MSICRHSGGLQVLLPASFLNLAKSLMTVFRLLTVLVMMLAFSPAETAEEKV
jgi:hypothetical protein